ncbi:MAG: T9SS type A sorting domain-containing protein [Saprospiraceae bacterium]|nr:T9SS type A sorting domain-containing protein [Saprospiraceae bacterium]
MILKTLTFTLLPMAVFMVLSSTLIDPNNPPTGRTGAPGETTCQASGCHSGGSYAGNVGITGLPDTVVANQTYTITLTNESNAIRAGYQLTVLDEANSKAGILSAGTGSSIGNAAGRQYVRQSSPKNLTNGAASWTFNWVAPESVENDSIHFYFATLCANSNGQKTGDNALKSVHSVVLPAIVSGTGELAKSPKIKLYPSPATDFVNVVFAGKSAVEVLDINGKSVLSTTMESVKKLDISQLEAGFYVVKLESEGKFVATTFFKK